MDSKDILNKLSVIGGGSKGDGRTTELMMIPWGQLRPAEKQDRTVFDEAKLRDMAASFDQRISEGLIPNTTPLDVVPVGEDQYEIVSGERRWRSCEYTSEPYTGPLQCLVMIGHSEKEIGDQMFLTNEFSVDKSHVENALAVFARIDDGSWDRRKAMAMTSWSESKLSRMMKLAAAPKEVQNLNLSGKITNILVLLDLADVGEGERQPFVSKIEKGSFTDSDKSSLNEIAKASRNPSTSADGGEHSVSEPQVKTRKPTKTSVSASDFRLLLERNSEIKRLAKDYAKEIYGVNKLSGLKDGELIEAINSAISTMRKEIE